MREWYCCTAEEVLDGLEVDRAAGETEKAGGSAGKAGSAAGRHREYMTRGLSSAQVRERLARYGENRLRESGRRPAWKVFIEQFQDLLVMILIGAAVISMLTDNVESTVVIFAVILMNAVLGTVQHQRAEKSLESLRALSAPSVRVLRDGVRKEIPSSEVVPGDLLYLEAGDLVAADGRLLNCTALKVNESSLTGESEAVEKSAEPVGRRTAKAERTCMVYSGSLVTAGVGTVIVTATGMDTEIGGIASLMEHAKEKRTPLQISLDQFSSRLAAAIMIVCLLVFALGVYRGMTLLDSLLFAVALAVAAIPEALGSIVTIVQAMGTQKMAKEQAIIKDLKAVESLGCVSVICTDKTGTLTQNCMSVEQAVIGGEIIPAAELNPADERQRFFLEACALVNNAEMAEKAEMTEAAGRKNPAERSEVKALTAKTPVQGVGDATELALLELAQSRGLSPRQIRRRYPRIGEIPFDSERKRMSTVHRIGGRPVLLCKGAADVLLKRCTGIAVSGNEDGRGTDGSVPAWRPMGTADRRRLEAQNIACSEQGLRVLGLAYRVLDTERTEAGKADAERAEVGRKEAGKAEAGRKKAGRAESGKAEAGRADAAGTGKRFGRAEMDAETGSTMENGMVFLGMAAMMDPPRPESAEAVADAKRAGIRTIMITGDHKVTAAAIARQIGILELEADMSRYAGTHNKSGGSAASCTVTGPELDAMSDRELDACLDQISVYARVTPQHKLRIVRAWQNRGRIVAMTGDGVNDAPALKQADIGVAMGRGGTEVSKDAADMILADDNFATIIKAVANGRNVYRNILGAIQFLLSGNMAGILCVLYTTLLALPLPFAPVHLLFINLLTDSLPALAIGMEPSEKGLLDGPPRDPKRGILTAGFIRDVLLQGGLIAVCTLCAYRIGLAGTLRLPEGIAAYLRGNYTFSNIAGSNAAAASTMAFATLTLARLFHGFNCRSRRSLFRLGLFSNIYTVLAFLAGTVLLVAVLLVPGLQAMFAAADLSREQLICVGFLAVVPTLTIQGWRLVKGMCRCLTRKDRRFL